EIVQRGFVFDETAGDILEEARNLVMLSLKASAEDEVTDPAVLEQRVRTTLRRHFWDATQRKPQIVPVIMEVSARVARRKSRKRARKRKQSDLRSHLAPWARDAL